MSATLATFLKAVRSSVELDRETDGVARGVGIGVGLSVGWMMERCMTPSTHLQVTLDKKRDRWKRQDRFQGKQRVSKEMQDEMMVLTAKGPRQGSQASRPQATPEYGRCR